MKITLNQNVSGSGWVLLLSLGRGAGYIGGLTAYLAWMAGSWTWLRDYRGGSRFPLQAGITQNANHVPYTSH